MTNRSKKEYIQEMRTRYDTATKEERTHLLDEMIAVLKFNRKYLIRLLAKKPERRHPTSICDEQAQKKPRVGHPQVYHVPEILLFLRTLWHATNQACGKRLKMLLSLWLPWYELSTGNRLSLLHHALIVRISAATIDRLLADERAKYRIGKGRTTTKPGTLLKHRIPIKTDQWSETRPGYLEADTVAHCGTSTAGMFVYSLNSVDTASGWTETRAIWGKGETGALRAIQSILEALPFPVKEFDSDNGGEFINHHLEKFFTGSSSYFITQTRSRDGKKNDNAHIEQKNWTHVRQTFGYERFDNPRVVDLMNDLYANEYRLFMNLFLPSVKLKEKVRLGSQIKKRHDLPQTPAQRLLASKDVPEETKERLRQLQASLNPFVLHEEIKRKVRLILQHCKSDSPSCLEEQRQQEATSLPQGGSIKQRKQTQRTVQPGKRLSQPRTSATPRSVRQSNYKKKNIYGK